MDIQKLNAIDQAIVSGDLEKEGAAEDHLIGEDSPYAEVRAAVCLDLCSSSRTSFSRYSNWFADGKNR